MKRILASLTSPPLLLVIVAVLAYGLLLPQLGFYWDDLPMSWIRYQLGPEAMAEYFSTNRPVWGLLYQVTTRLFPQVPMYWQVFALVMRWLTGLLAWAILRELFPRQPHLALGAALLFLVYPGFNQQSGAYLYSHFFIVLNFCLFSHYLMLRAWRERYWLKTGFAMLFSALNLWMHEYFFVLELMRPAVIWTALREEGQDFNTRLRRTPSATLRAGMKLWAPYLAVFVAAVFSRLFIFNNQIYEIGGDPAEIAPFNLLTTIPSSLWTVTVAAWAQAFRLPDLASDGPRTTLVYGAVTLVTYGALVAAFFRRQAKDALQSRRAEPAEAPSKDAVLSSSKDGSDRKDAFWAIGLGLFILLVAGWPFWLTGVPVSLSHPANRATLSFMLGSSLLLAGLLSLLPRQLNWILLAVFVSLAAGRQFQWSNEFRRDWDAQKNLFWQMTWRAPGLEPGTIVLMNEELAFYADNSIGAALNWIYAPDNHSNRVDYVLFYPKNRLGGSLPGFVPGLPVTYDYLAGQFVGDTSQVVAFYYAPPGCLRLLDPEIDSVNILLPEESLLRNAALITSTKFVSGEPVARMPGIYGPEPAHRWCYYFERAELARQTANWGQVVILGDQAFSSGDYPNDPLERFVFIEGYAHIGDWEQALEYSQVSYKVSKNFVGPLLCRLWDRIDREVAASPEKEENVAQAKTLFGCNP